MATWKLCDDGSLSRVPEEVVRATDLQFSLYWGCADVYNPVPLGRKDKWRHIRQQRGAIQAIADNPIMARSRFKF